MRYGPNFVQRIDPTHLATLSPVAQYIGDAADLQHLRGVPLKTAEVEKLIYVGERENVLVDDQHGLPSFPWRYIMITELDENGRAVVDGYVNAPPLPTYGPRAMSAADLRSLGMTDADLDALAQHYLGERWEPDRPGPSDARRAMFDRVMAASFG